ncbi:MAG: hypothetical protein COZ06_17740 [Armatimonadetes bacterium CG_4_10_14_3_um_filter_66_18]|nr:hypothetical protein [Armatimonadota bacterium]OIP00537.1 MAG: hypothetical protein AUJ96_18445 [Armatimonadetes bacterium CG2_30_66_41]PIX37197.1 MAG: hypothetical protein COZ57_35540 [Armatimonadetes bacterium CG_4_8_14_3_um_filter_66_20]PIY47456.1 MAG: hypothetical protein COZ06_17740 [Armatimonadetes bacterium CG_4_10_14_3_um_filter_66_18]PIZ50651.1 MAG: hypothetical protein COY42_01170 [Armatimonadetes bacterium CG_4_10_14_0_8_um_filter_66_14]PJB72928.1 MAG: hypothetical protein CO096_
MDHFPMNDLQRFKAVCHFDKPDYVPLFGFPGAPGMSGGCMRKTHERLVDTGMPEWVDGCISLGEPRQTEVWERYWGTTAPVGVGVLPTDDYGRGIRHEKRVEDKWEVIEAESGAYTRQVLENDVTYSMPEFIRYHVRDRKSWEFYRDRTTPGERWSTDRIDEACRCYDERVRPACVSVGSTFGLLRGLMGPYAASTVFYDDPALAREILEWQLQSFETYTVPVIERIRPEILGAGEDCCFNHGMLLSPRHFDEFCAPFYRKVCEVARDCGVDMVSIDTDGNAMEFVGVVERYGVNAIYPFEVKAGNNLFVLRERHPRFLLLGWLEKECVNEGNDHRIQPEIMSKVPPLLATGGYFPNGDHGLQPMVTFENLCKFMTLLHDVTGNPEGEFPRVRP